MGIVKRQGIKASFLVYIGFLLGAINILFFFPRVFTEEQVGLTRVLTSTTITFAQLCLLGLPSVMLKFYPYYKDHTKDKNDLLFIVSAFALLGFVIVSSLSWLFYDKIVVYFSEKSPLLSEYFFLTFIGGFFLAVYTIFETFSRSNLRNVLPMFLREVGLRLYTLIIIIIYGLGWLSFNQFIWLFSIYFSFACIVMVIELTRLSLLKVSLNISHVTRRLKGKMLGYGSFVYGGGVFAIIADNVDTFLIAGIAGLKSTGIFTIASYISTILQVPQRTISSISTPILARSWKDKDYKNIQYLYEKSSLNQLIFGFTIFLLIWINIDQLFSFLPPAYAEGKYVVLILCITRLIDLGTGVNGEILITSNFWRFNFMTHVSLVILSIPMNYFFITHFGIIGSAYSNLIAYSMYNATRFLFIWRKYNMQPFSINTLYVLMLAGLTYFITLLIPDINNVWLQVPVNVVLVLVFFVLPILWFRISDDFRLLFHQIIERVRNLIK